MEPYVVLLSWESLSRMQDIYHIIIILYLWYLAFYKHLYVWKYCSCAYMRWIFGFGCKIGCDTTSSVSCAATACAACLVTCPAARTHLLHALLLPEPLVSLRVQPFMLASSIRCYACQTARAHLFCVRHAVRRAPHAWLLSMCLASLYV
jgi:hypothetical protein